ncbi:MAG TPA: ATP-binding protein, partial [bacterium]|nr:ATP-binding protein [bacterium]
ALNQMVQNLRDEQQRILQLEKTATWREMAQRMAHEIKNPLTPIQLTIQQIKDSYAGNDEKYRKLLTECTTIIEEEIETLRNLTKEFSDFARMPVVVLKPSSLNKLIEDIILMYAAIPFEKKLDDRLPFIPLDTEAFKRVLINLIDNALAAVSNKQDRLIRIATIDVNTHVQLIIADNGYGIPKSNLERIFEPHFSTKTTSMGLGLAIVKKIIEEHQGTISVDSIENLGTTFTITLPKENPS